MHTCPLDRSQMRAVALPGGGIEYVCARCAGLWLPGRLVQAAIGATPLDRARPAGAPRSLRCPNDGTALQALHHHGVEIDVCPHCAGAWLDAGERDKILRQRAPSLARRAADATADAGNGIDLIDIAGDVGSAVLEFIGDAFTAL